jgi:magnesium chelatase family protein
MDRIDLHLCVPAVRYRDLASGRRAEGSAAVRERVEAARVVQQQRTAGLDGQHCNAQIDTAGLRAHCAVCPSGARLLELAMDRFGLSARAHGRILRVARTIADLAGEAAIAPDHVAEAIGYRQMDRHI